MKIEVASITDVGRVRAGNEDAVGCFPVVGLFVVCDGMGGHADGEIASRLAVESIRDAYGAGEDPTLPRLAKPRGLLDRLREWWRGLSAGGVPPRMRLEAAVRRANERLHREGIERAGRSDKPPLGTTVVALHLADGAENATWAHVGDSRLYRLRGGALELLTADHTHYGQPYWGKTPIPLDMPHTNQLLQALGNAPEVSIDVGSAATEAGDVYLLCSDGLYGGVAPDDLVARLSAPTPVEPIARALVDLANEAGGRDNISAVVVRLRAN